MILINHNVMKSGVTVADVMSLKPVSIDLEKSVSDCAKLMIKKKIAQNIIKAKNTIMKMIMKKLKIIL